ncbi:MAG: peptidase MA family metallohydrolase, partial [Chthoniobacteraceae bacterium]
ALKFDPEYLPAKAQLAQDLLRLGKDDEGWKLAEEVQTADPYNVFAYNLVTLRESLSKFKTLTSQHFIVRMDPKEAEVYGDRVVALLERAHAQLGKKYGMEPKEKTIVEIFPDQKDFAIRTFGLPGGAGYLGVCFGRLITANSPASRPGSATNWEAVLWHEYAHVVTLQLTRNRMPRWLSEGISVYEERQARGTWGEQMKPRYRAMILGEDLTPVSGLSGAFLKPKSPIHLQFAYYESSLVVEYLLERYGLDAMKKIFADLGKGMAINEALAKHAAPLAQIDKEFAERAQALARNTGPKLDWTQPEPAKIASEEALRTWVKENPENYSALMEEGRHLLEERQWEAAKAPLRKLIELYPNQHEGQSAYTLLAMAHRELGETDEELAVLKQVADLSSEAPEAYARLMELSAERKDWAGVSTYAEQYEAVDPLSPLSHRYAGQAMETLGQVDGAIERYRTLLSLNPVNPSDTHFRLARLLRQGGKSGEARRHVLQALEEAPRFREALDLLLQMQGTN